MANDMRLSLILSAKDRMSSIIKSSTKKSEKAFADFEKRLEKTSSVLAGLGKKSAIAGAALTTASGLNLKNAADFEASMANVSTLIDTNVESVDSMGKSVLNIAKKTPVAINELTSALYDVRSAGISASDQFNVLEKSAQLGVVGLGSTKEAVDLVTSSINSFNLKGEEQSKLYDYIFKTIKTGKTTISGLAQGFGSVAGTVSAAGIKIDDYLASIAALTTTGQPASQAHTQMKAAIAGLTRNTKEQQKVFQALGAKDFNDLIKKSGSVVNAFSGINRVTRGNKSRMIELLGSIEAYNAVLSLTGNQNKAYADTLYDMRNGVNAFDAGYAKKLDTINAQLQRGRNLIQKIGIDLGNYIAPTFKKALNVVEMVLNKFDALPDPIKEFISVSTLFAGVGLTAFGTLSMAASGAVNMFKNALKSYRFLSQFMHKHRFTVEIKAIKALSTAIRGVGIAISSTPVGLAAFALIAGAGLLIYKYWKPLKAFFNGFITGLKISLKPAIDGVKIAIEPYKPILDKISSALKTLGKIIKDILTPVETAGNRTKNWGVACGDLVGKLIKGGFAVVGFLVKINPLISVLKAIYLNFDRISAAITGTSDKLKIFFSRFNKDKTIGITASLKDTKSKIIDGSHRNGLSLVPKDGYIAELHKGERVLTASENRTLRKGSINDNVIYLTYNPVINVEKMQNELDLKAVLEQHERKLIDNLRTEQRRMKARAYA